MPLLLLVRSRSIGDDTNDGRNRVSASQAFVTVGYCSAIAKAIKTVSAIKSAYKTG